MKLFKSLLLLGIFFLPFNSFEGFRYIGEFSKDSVILFFIPLSILVLLLTGKITLPYKSKIFHMLILFVLWIIVSMVLNSYDSYFYFFKGTGGYSRFFSQFISLLISTFFLFSGYYFVFKKSDLLNLFFRIRSIILYSFIVVSVCATFEFLILRLNISFLEKLYNLFDYFPFTEVNLDYRNKRLSSVTFEPPALATYLITIAGWMFSYILTEKGLKKYIPGLLIVALGLFSGSRSSLFIILIQMVAFILILGKKAYYRVYIRKIMTYSLIASCLVVIFFGKGVYTFVEEKVTSFSINDAQLSNSNKSRFGTYTALWRVFLKKPVVGAGFGQQAFLAKDLYPDWAVKNNWEFRLKYLNEEFKSFPPGYNVYLRILAETGVVGLIIFLSFWLMIIRSCVVKLRSSNKIINLIGMVLFVSMIGLFLNWFKMDTFRVYGFWINLAFLLALNNMINERYTNSSPNPALQ